MAFDLSGLKPLGEPPKRSGFDLTGLKPVDPVETPVAKPKIESGLFERAGDAAYDALSRFGESQVAVGRTVRKLDQAPEKAGADSWSEIGRKLVARFPDLVRESVGGIVQSAIEGAPGEAEAYFQQRGGYLTQAERQDFADTREGLRLAGERGEIPGQKLQAEAAKRLDQNATNVDPWSAKGLAFNIAESGAQMLPSIAAAIFTRSPSVGAGIMSGQVYGQRYGQSRREGRSAEQATADGAFYAVAEFIPERIALGSIMKPGGTLFGKVAKGAGAEALQEVVTEALQSGYNAGVLGEEMTWGEAVNRLAYAGVIGGVLGGGIGGAVGVTDRLRSPTPEPNGDLDFAAPSTDQDREKDRRIQTGATLLSQGDTEPQPAIDQTRKTGLPDQAIRDAEATLTPEDDASPIDNAMIVAGRAAISEGGKLNTGITPTTPTGARPADAVPLYDDENEDLQVGWYHAPTGKTYPLDDPAGLTQSDGRLNSTPAEGGGASAQTPPPALGLIDPATVNSGISGDGTPSSPIIANTPEDVDAAVQRVNTSPTDGQKEAGNYAKAHVRFAGLDIAIENPRGSERSGVDPDGNGWSVEMPGHYGYVKKTLGADGDQFDVYLGNNPQSETVYVVDQVDAKTGKFDEHKAMVGFNSEAEAMDAYAAGFSDGKGPARMGSMTRMSVPEFREYLKGDTTKPVGALDQAQEPAVGVEAQPDMLGGATVTTAQMNRRDLERRAAEGDEDAQADLERITDSEANAADEVDYQARRAVEVPVEERATEIAATLYGKGGEAAASTAGVNIAQSILNADDNKYLAQPFGREVFERMTGVKLPEKAADISAFMAAREGKGFKLLDGAARSDNPTPSNDAAEVITMPGGKATITVRTLPDGQFEVSGDYEIPGFAGGSIGAKGSSREIAINKAVNGFVNQVNPDTFGSAANDKQRQLGADMRAWALAQKKGEGDSAPPTVEQMPSGKSVIVKGATDAQLAAIKAAIPAGAMPLENKRAGGWVYSKKYEDKINAALARSRMIDPIQLTEDGEAPKGQTATSAPPAVSKQDALKAKVAAKSGELRMGDYTGKEINGYDATELADYPYKGGTKEAFHNDASAYLKAAATHLAADGFAPLPDRKGKPGKAVTVNRGGMAVSGEVSLVLARPDGNGVYVQISAGSMSQKRGFSIMARRASATDRYGTRSGNEWLETGLTAAELADRLRRIAGPVVDAATDNNRTAAKDTARLQSVRELGAKDFRKGSPRVPLTMPADEQRAWLEGWDRANLAAPVPESGASEPTDDQLAALLPKGQDEYEALVKGKAALNVPDGFEVDLARKVKDPTEARIKGGEYTAVARRMSPWASEAGYGDTAEAAQADALRRLGVTPTPSAPKPALDKVELEPGLLDALAQSYPNAGTIQINNEGRREGRRDALKFASGWDMHRSGRERFQTIGAEEQTGWDARQNAKATTEADRLKAGIVSKSGMDPNRIEVVRVGGDNSTTAGSGATLVTDDRMDELRARLRNKMGNQLNAGVDPEVFSIGAELALGYMERGVLKVAALTKRIADDLDTTAAKLKPYIEGWYNGARGMWRGQGRDVSGLDSAADVEAYVDGLDSGTKDTASDTTGTKGQNDGLQNRVPGGNAGAGTADVQRTAAQRGDGQPSDTEVSRGAPDVGGADGGRGQGGERRGDRPTGQGVSGTAGAGNIDRVSTDGRQAEPDRSRTPAAKRPDAAVTGENYVIEPGALDEARGWSVKARDNVAAIKTLKAIEAEDRPATKAEQEQLARYVGFGGLAKLFEDMNLYGGAGAQLRELMTDKEYQEARSSTQYAHYTSETIVRQMWKLAQQLGFRGGQVFEPGMGVGNFAGMMPTEIAAVSQYSGLELDPITARIAKLLYPKWGVREADMTKTPLPQNQFDLVIGNPPFADIAIKTDPAYAKQGFLLHDYFFAKSLDAVRPGGLLMFVTSAGTMNKLDSKAREYLNERAALIGAIRLPGDAFKQNAGTQVTTDIIVLQKRDPANLLWIGKSWINVEAVTLNNKDGDATTGNVNSYFVANPEKVLGEEGFFDKLYPGRYGVRMRDGQDFAADLEAAVATFQTDIMSARATPTEAAKLDFNATERKDGSFYIEGGKLHQLQYGVGREVKLTIRSGQKHGWRTMIWDAHVFAGWMTEQLDAKIVRGDR